MTVALEAFLAYLKTLGIADNQVITVSTKWISDTAVRVEAYLNHDAFVKALAGKEVTFDRSLNHFTYAPSDLLSLYCSAALVEINKFTITLPVSAEPVTA